MDCQSVSTTLRKHCWGVCAGIVCWYGVCVWGGGIGRRDKVPACLSCHESSEKPSLGFVETFP